MIGFDPLAWMNNDDGNSQTTESSEVEQASESAVDVKAGQSVNESAEPTVPAEVVQELTAESQAVEEMADASVSENGAGQADEFKIILDATLNIQKVGILYEHLLVLLEGQDKIEVDASEVTSIDTATLQLLIVLKQAAIKLHKEVIFDFPSDKFIESAEVLGLAEMLEIDQAAAGFF